VTGEIDATVPSADAAAVDNAVQHAHAAFDGEIEDVCSVR
jgi:acyl-CoA reductase-like NAD-dependent aldehyde dehydrogenase